MAIERVYKGGSGHVEPAEGSRLRLIPQDIRELASRVKNLRRPSLYAGRLAAEANGHRKLDTDGLGEIQQASSTSESVAAKRGVPQSPRRDD